MSNGISRRAFLATGTAAALQACISGYKDDSDVPVSRLESLLKNGPKFVKNELGSNPGIMDFEDFMMGPAQAAYNLTPEQLVASIDNIDGIGETEPTNHDIYAHILTHRPDLLLPYHDVTIDPQASQVHLPDLVMQSLNPDRIKHYIENWQQEMGSFSGGVVAFLNRFYDSDLESQFAVIPRSEGVYKALPEAMLSRLETDLADSRKRDIAGYFLHQDQRPIVKSDIYNLSNDGIVVPTITLYRDGYFFTPVHISGEELKELKVATEVEQAHLSHYLNDQAPERYGIDAALAAGTAVLVNPILGGAVLAVNLMESNRFGNVMRKSFHHFNPDQEHFSQEDYIAMTTSPADGAFKFMHPVLGNNGRMKGLAAYEIGGPTDNVILYNNGVYVAQSDFIRSLAAKALSTGALVGVYKLGSSMADTKTTFVDRIVPGAGHGRDGGNIIDGGAGHSRLGGDIIFGGVR